MIKQVLDKIGDGIAWLTQKSVVGLSGLGVKTGLVHAKIISILLFSILIYLTIKFLSKINKLIKWGILITLFILILITVISLV